MDVSICVKDLQRKKSTTYVFTNDLLQRMAKYPPGEYFDVLLNIARLWGGEAHDHLEEVFAIGFCFRNSKWPEAFQVPANTILLFHGESNTNQRLKEVDRIDARYEAFIFTIPVDATNADTVGSTVFGSNWVKIRMDGAPTLHTSELNQATLGLTLLFGPAFCHRVQAAIELQNSLRGIHGIGVE